jgi:hypothetical protein
MSGYSQNGQVFGHNYPGWGSQLVVYPAGISDGTSNTIFFTDKLAICDRVYSPPDQYSYPYNYWPDWGPIIASTQLSRGGLGLNSAPQFQPGPSSLAGANGVPGGARDCDGSRASTFHSGGIVTGMGDGSVRTVRNGVSVQTWWAALTRDGGETLGSDW